MRYVWIPEAPDHPGLYANDSDSTGRQSDGSLQPSTMEAWKAKQFKTEAECRAWCEANPVPAFVPKEHGFDQ